MTKPANISAASFRDPAGFIFSEHGVVKRAVTQKGAEDYTLFMQSGLYGALLSRGWIVPHSEETTDSEGLFKILVPEPVSVWTYPYEWSFSQFKAAAVLTLEIQQLALQHGLCLKDATPFNIQFINGRPVLIDTLSFEKFKERPWYAYRQFCETFLAPLALMAEKRVDFNRLLTVDLGGVDLTAASRSLPFRTRFNFGYLTHIHLHAMSQARHQGAGADEKKRTATELHFSKFRMTSFVDSLLSCAKGIDLKRKDKTSFADYYGECSHYSKEADEFKVKTVEAWIGQGNWKLALDLGGNIGKYSRLLTKRGIQTVCADFDPYCVDENYRISSKDKDSKMLPVVLDLTNPTPDLGWANEERTSFFKRVKPDLVMALALIHHLRITAGVPLQNIARFFSTFAPELIIEFVPKGDPMTDRLIAGREDIFSDYDAQGFEASFGAFYETRQKVSIPSTTRTLYLLKKK